MLQEDRPVALADLHAFVRDLHVAAGVVHWAAGGVAQIIHQQLLFPRDAVVAAVLPEAAELSIGAQARQQVVGESGDALVASEALVKRFFTHKILLPIEQYPPAQPGLVNDAFGERFHGQLRGQAFYSRQSSNVLVDSEDRRLASPHFPNLAPHPGHSHSVRPGSAKGGGQVGVAAGSSNNKALPGRRRS